MTITIKNISEISHYKLRSLSRDIDDIPNMSSCPACNSSNHSYLYEITDSIKLQPNSRALRKLICMNCGHGYFEKIPLAGNLSEFYEKDWHEEINVSENTVKVTPNYSTWAPINYLRELSLPKETKILDFGCGYGDGIKTLELDGYNNVFGIEVGQARFDISSREFPEKIFKGTELQIPEIVKEHGQFDLIYSNHVFEHLSDTASVLKYLKEALAPNGMLAVSVPAPGSESAVHTALYYPHLHNYSEQSLQNLFQSIDLKTKAWSGSDNQLAVVGSYDENNLPSENFHKIVLSPNESITTHLSIRDDLINQVGNAKKNVGVLTFCHPWSDYKQRKSGTNRDVLALDLVVKSYDLLLRLAFYFLPNKLVMISKRIIRSVFYRTFASWKISPSVDKLYFLYDDRSEPDHKLVSFYFDGDLKVLDK